MTKKFILLNSIIEITAGLIFLFYPTLIPGVSITDATGIGYARMYGAGAIAFAWIMFKIWKLDYEATNQIALRTISVFHTGVVLAALMGYNSGAEDFLAVAIFHALMAIISFYFVISNRS